MKLSCLPREHSAKYNGKQSKRKSMAELKPVQLARSRRAWRASRAPSLVGNRRWDGISQDSKNPTSLNPFLALFLANLYAPKLVCMPAEG